VSSPTLAAPGPITIDLTATAREAVAPCEGPPGGSAAQVSVVSVLSDDPRRRCTARPSLPGATLVPDATIAATVPPQRSDPPGALRGT